MTTPGVTNRLRGSRRVGVLQLAGDIHDFDADKLVSLIIEDNQIVDIALAVSWVRFFFEADVKRIHVILIVKPQLTRREMNSPARSIKQFFFAGNDYSSWFSLRHTMFALAIASSRYAERINPS
jgi:hypothetical protein